MTAPTDKAYLGDGVHVAREGAMLHLTTENGRAVTNAIYLEPQVYAALVAYVERTKDAKPTTTTGNQMHTPDTKTVSQLADLLSTALTFVDTYEAAIGKVGDPYVRQQLEECQRSHQMRVDILREEIEDLGGEVDDARRTPNLVMADTVLGEDAAIAFLHDAEDHALAHYRRGIDGLDFDVRDLVEGDLLPEQERTHAIITSLKTDH